MDPMPKDSLTRWPHWPAALIILAAFFSGWIFSGLLPGAAGDATQAENRQLQQQVRKFNQEIAILQAQITDYQALEQVQQEMITMLQSGNHELQDKLMELDQRVQQYKQVIEKR